MYLIKKTLFFLFIITVNTYLFAQENTTYYISYDKIPGNIVLDDIEYKFLIDFIYKIDIIKSIYIKLPKKKRNLQQTLNDIEKVSNLRFTRIDNTHFYVSNLNVIMIQENEVINNFLTKGIHKNTDGSYALNLNKLELLPGLIEPDVLESIQQFPNIISTDETSSNMNVRGGEFYQNSIIWDDINIYLTGHFFGMISAFNPYVSDKINFYDKATNAKYDERVSSVTDIRTSDLIAKKTKFQLGINTISSDGILTLPLIKEKMDLQLSYRRSYEHLYETSSFKKYEEKAFQHAKIQNENFNFNDYNAKINIQINNKNTIHLSMIHIDNDLDNTRIDNTKTYNDILDIENTGYSAKWVRNWTDRIKQKTSYSTSKYALFYNLKTIHTPSFSSYLNKKNNIKDTKISTDLNFHLKKGNVLNFGYQYKKQQVNFKIKNKKDIIYTLDKDDSSVETHSLYSGLTMQKTLNYFIYLGVRANYYKNFESYKVEPRFMINKYFTPFFKFQITGEFKNQIVHQIEETILGSYTIENKLWRLSNNQNIPMISSNHFSSEISYERNKWNIQASVYHKTINGISSLSLGYLNPNNNIFHKGNTIIKGASIQIDKNFGKINSWINYSYMDANSRFNGIYNDAYFTSNIEIKHALNTAITYKNKNFQIAINWKYRTGKPFSILNYDSNNNTYLKEINTKNLPDFHRLDISSTYKFFFSKKKKTKGQVGVSVRNLYNNKNIIARVYSGNNSINEPVVYRDFKALGITPNFTFRVFF